jgi:cytochrome c oxidase subunit 4
VGASYLNLRNVAVVAAIIIATVKASLVALYFMHLRFENRLYSIILLTSLGFLAICFILAFFDYSFR